MKRIKFPQHNKRVNITAIQANILKSEFYCISKRNQTKKATIVDRYQTRLSDAGFLFLAEIKNPAWNFLDWWMVSIKNLGWGYF